MCIFQFLRLQKTTQKLAKKKHTEKNFTCTLPLDKTCNLLSKCAKIRPLERENSCYYSSFLLTSVSRRISSLKKRLEFLTFWEWELTQRRLLITNLTTSFIVHIEYQDSCSISSIRRFRHSSKLITRKWLLEALVTR